MKVDPPLKWIFYTSFSILYISGVAEYFIAGPSSAQSLALRIHGIIGLWFLYLFGHFFKAHIWPSLRFSRHRKTGLILWGGLIALSLTVPLLYYLSNEQVRNWTVAFHTYLGILVIVPLLGHIFLAIFRR